MNECKHIFGYCEGYADVDDMDFEAPRLIDNKAEINTIDVKFIYCPKCGLKINENNTRK